MYSLPTNVLIPLTFGTNLRLGLKSFFRWSTLREIEEKVPEGMYQLKVKLIGSLTSSVQYGYRETFGQISQALPL